MGKKKKGHYNWSKVLTLSHSEVLSLYFAGATLKRQGTVVPA